MPFPSIALLRDLNWSAQAKITLKKTPKCYIGKWEEELPSCSEGTPRGACDCVNDWISQVQNFWWRDKKYEMLQLQTKASDVSVGLDQPLFVQTFFSCTWFQFVN